MLKQINAEDASSLEYKTQITSDSPWNELKNYYTIICQHSQIDEKDNELDLHFTALALIETLNFLEKYCYEHNRYSCKTLLHDYLHNGFNLLPYIEDTHGLNHNINLDLNNIPNKQGFSEKYIKHEYQHKIGKPETDYINSYLYDLTTIKGLSKYTVYKSSQRNDSFKKGCKEYPKYYISACELTEFLLDFAFRDGRDFSNRDNFTDSNRLPRRTYHTHNTEKAFSQVIDQINLIISNTNSETPQLIFSVYNADAFFHIHTLNMLNAYMDTYTSDSFLEQIYNTCNLSYETCKNLPLLIRNAILNDSKFINTIFSSHHFNCLLYFDIYINAFTINTYRNYRTIDELIKSSKEFMYKCLSIKFKPSKYREQLKTIFFSGENNTISLLNMTSEELHKNSLFKKYYVTVDVESLFRYIEYETLIKYIYPTSVTI